MSWTIIDLLRHSITARLQLRVLLLPLVVVLDPGSAIFQISGSIQVLHRMPDDVHSLFDSIPLLGALSGTNESYGYICGAHAALYEVRRAINRLANVKSRIHRNDHRLAE